MSAVRAASQSPFAAAMLAGPVQNGLALAGAHALFGDRVLTITPPGALRMPNGIEAELRLVAGEPVSIGAGALRTSTTTLVGGGLWNPRPRPRVRLCLLPHPELDLDRLAGRGPGLTPLGDDVLIGYVAGIALAGADTIAVRKLAASYGHRTTALSSTLLMLAAAGRLPEAAHRLLSDGDLEPLLAFGATSGRGIAVGLGLAGGTSTGPRPDAILITLPLGEPAWRFQLAVAPLEDAGCS